MSSLLPMMIACPRCGAKRQAGLYESLNGDILPNEVELIAAGEFERMTCEGCGHLYQPEHHMLFVRYSWHAWIVMQPLGDRPRFERLERGVTQVLEREFAAAPQAVAAALLGTRARLVFGHHMLAEAVRALQHGIDPALLECAKLLAMRENLPRFIGFGPNELCFERIGDNGELVLAPWSLPKGERLDGTLVLPSSALGDARASQAQLARAYPELFEKPYVSASRYLIDRAI